MLYDESLIKGHPGFLKTLNCPGYISINIGIIKFPLITSFQVDLKHA